jgi:SpoVK/Ycf46/Vps4 family AAA+-type ATPase
MPTTAPRAALNSHASVLRSDPRRFLSATVARASAGGNGHATRTKRKPGTRILLTAKTPAQRRQLAESVSTELNRELIRIDVGAVMRKFIGDTEKNLRARLESAESQGAIIFLDEADALFGKRTQVKDAHDRYANVEVSYLLERVEASPCVVILATNRASNIDPAFLRRLRFAIKLSVPTPKAAQRSKTRAAGKPRKHR